MGRGSPLLLLGLLLQLQAPRAGGADEPSCGSGQPCPPWSTCVSWAGHFSCRCALGFHFNQTMGCVPARMFPGRLSLRAPAPAPPSPLPPADLRRIIAQLESLFQPVLGQLDAYLSSSVLDLQPHSQAVTILHSFSALSSVTAQQVDEAIVGFWVQCQASDPACSFLRDTVSYQSLSLCELQPCDPVSTSCVFQDGLAQCPCRPGYRPALAMGRACAACGSGFWLRDGVCARCPFGFGGFQCEEPFLLALVGVSCAGGVLLLLLLAALLLLGRAKALAQRPSLAEPVVPPFQPQQLSLPRVRPPRPLEEVEIRELGHGDRLGPGRVLAAGPRMKTFQGSQSSPGLAPRPGGGQSNLVFVSDEEWGRRKC
ncbi:protein HEG-like isoform X13 [Malaclemys terrapin pileata]|uniref:protein HEG-like isoform X13 n=1 Tax=Malaclemys terrapin pileata TaxID=2991368 RepID=UPI0023A7BE11|nr:protein HEG-like isoform X13 [Malaclemys terrapin pileata]